MYENADVKDERADSEKLFKKLISYGGNLSNRGIFKQAIQWGVNSIKGEVLATFGKEYSITSYSGYKSDVKTAIVRKFIKKYDKHFDKHVRKIGANDNDSYALLDRIFLIPLGDTRDTFMYIAVGSNSTSLEHRFKISRDIDNDDMYIYIFGKRMQKYSKELDEIISDEYTLDNLGIFTVDSSRDSSYRDNGEVHETLDIRYMPMEPRDASTMFFSFNELDHCIEHVDRFFEQKEAYKKHQLPYKTGILLYGKAGTGKTSGIRALATKYDRDIVNVNVAHLMNIDLTRLSEAITLDDYREYIVVLEDIDCLFLNREAEGTTRDDQAILNKMLNFLDGQSSPSNVIFVATTNHKERLDEALLRHGRFDLHVEVRELKEEDVFKFAQSFDLPDAKTVEIIREYPVWAEANDKKIDHDAMGAPLYNQSAIQGMILNKLEHKNREVKIIDTSEEVASQIEEEDKEEDE